MLKWEDIKVGMMVFVKPNIRNVNDVRRTKQGVMLTYKRANKKVEGKIVKITEAVTAHQVFLVEDIQTKKHVDSWFFPNEVEAIDSIEDEHLIVNNRIHE